MLKVIAIRRHSAVINVVRADPPAQPLTTIPSTVGDPLLQLKESRNACTIRLDTEALCELKGA